MNAHDFIVKVAAHTAEINKTLEEFLSTEQVHGGNNLSSAKVTAYDILYKYLWAPYREDNREALSDLAVGSDWQASDLTVFEKTESTTAVIKLGDYSSKVARTGRVGEDRKGYIPLAEKRAKELGYTTAKEASI